MFILRAGHAGPASTPIFGPATPTARIDAPTVQSQTPPCDMNTGKIVVVDQDPASALSLCRQLEELGRPATAAVTRAQALQAIIELAPEVVFLDLDGQGDLDGVEIARRIPEHLGVAVVFRTASSQASALDRAKDVRPSGYLFKPHSVQALRGALQTAQGRHELTCELRQARMETSASMLANAARLAELAHDIRTPLAGIAGFTELLARTEGLPDRARGFVDRIAQSGAALRRIIQDALNLASPLPRPADAATKAPSPVGEADAPPARLLLVDDLEANRELMREFLAPLGADVHEAADGREAVEKAAATAFDLILMDLQMPGMDGLAAARAIRGGSKLNRSTPILAVSAHARHADAESCLAAGIDGLLDKPHDQGAFLAEIARWIGQSRRAEAGNAAPGAA